MIDAVILIPSIMHSRSQSSEDGILRDSLLLAPVFALHSMNISLPRGMFVAAGFFVLFSEIINDLTYRLLPPSVKFKETWLNLQSRQIKKDLIRYIELRNDGAQRTEASDNYADVLRDSHMGIKGSQNQAEKVATRKDGEA
jgi:hypothetical protein